MDIKVTWLYCSNTLRSENTALDLRLSAINDILTAQQDSLRTDSADSVGQERLHKLLNRFSKIFCRSWHYISLWLNCGVSMKPKGHCLFRPPDTDSTSTTNRSLLNNTTPLLTGTSHLTSAVVGLHWFSKTWFVSQQLCAFLLKISSIGKVLKTTLVSKSTFYSQHSQ